MVFRVIVAFIGLLTLGSTVRGDGMVPVFGPKRFERTSGRPDQYNEIFRNCETAAQFRLVVQNGNSDGSGRTSSAVVRLNGVEVIGPNDFDRTVATIAKPVVIGQTNQIIVQLASAPGSSIAVSIECVNGCLAIRISSPVSGSSIASQQIAVAGNISSSADEIGVQVNGEASLVQGSQFAATSISLTSGNNQITATATNACGNQATATASVTASNTTPRPITFRVVPSNGVAPLSVTIAADVSSQNPIASYQWDFNGDGNVDAFGSNLSSVTTTYGQPGLYLVKLTTTDIGGRHLSGEVPIAVLSRAAVTTLIQTRWNSFKSALGSKDVAGALGFVHPGFTDQYHKVFSTLAQQLPQIASSLSNLDFISVSGGLAEVATTRTQNGTPFVYFIYFMQDSNGLWKIVSL